MTLRFWTPLATCVLLFLGRGMLHASEPYQRPFAARLGAPLAVEAKAAERKADRGEKALGKFESDGEQPKKLDDPKQGEAKSKFQAVGSDLSLKASWRDGLHLETPLKDFKVHVGGRVHQDWVWFDQNENLTKDKSFGPLNDSVFFRRARLKVDGTAYEVVDWVAEFEFAVVTDVVPRNVWVQITQLPLVGQFRAGHFREPFSLERMTSGRDITFMERSAMDDAFVPAFSPGMMLWDAPMNERVTWAVGFFRNTPEPDTGIDLGNGEYAWTGRVTGIPWYENEGRCLLHLGAGYSHRSAEFDSAAAGKAVRLRSRPRFRAPGLPRFADTGLLRADGMDLFGAEAALVLGPFSVQAEYQQAIVSNAVSPAVKGVPRGDPAFRGGYVMMSYFLTGEYRAYDRRAGAFGRVRPHEPFFFVGSSGKEEAGEWSLGRGAWEIAVQYGWLDLNDSGIQGGILEDTTLALNWYLNPNVNIQWNLTAAHRQVPAPLQSGVVVALGMRFNLEF